MKARNICTIIITLIPLTIFAQDIEHYSLLSDSTIKGQQNIHILEFDLDEMGALFELDLAWSDSILITTSEFAESNQSLAAINGGFFSIKDGGAVTYLEYHGKQVSNRSWRGDLPVEQKTNMNAALILAKDGELKIENIRSSTEYLNSDEEQWVMTAGPMLIQSGIKSELLNGSFTTKKHPRTCVALTTNSLLLITIDGRHEEARGASLTELQNFLINLNCIDAMNLDGGGSTTLWMNNEVINCPSDNKKFDNKGERKVANIILVLSTI
ncbi:MAG: phosphodiester glycosidase family protein [Bacteroidales bacterium]|nr:phosphodiester glycosidase family protein [Bacteroidales bacterium]